MDLKFLEIANSSKDFYNSIMKEVVDKYHINYTELEFLMFINCYKDYNTITKISKNYHVIKSKVCMAIKSLWIKGFVEYKKSDTDKKTTYIILTKKGEKIVKDGLLKEELYKEVILSGFSAEDKSQLVDCMDKMMKNISNYRKEKQVC